MSSLMTLVSMRVMIYEAGCYSFGISRLVLRKASSSSSSSSTASKGCSRLSVAAMVSFSPVAGAGLTTAIGLPRKVRQRDSPDS